MNVLLFLGAGISFASKLPNIRSITSKILHDQWFLHTDGRFLNGSPTGIGSASEVLRSCPYTRNIQKFLNILKDFGDRSRDSNEWGEIQYEELYDLVSVLIWDLHGPPSPATGALRNEILPLAEGLSRESDILNRQISLEELLQLSRNFIVDVVRHHLQTPEQILGLNFITEAASDSEVHRLDLATLNHDCIVEHLLRNLGLTVTDGFGEPDGAIRHFNPQAYSSSAARIRLYKLHGSINWHMIQRFFNGKLKVQGPALVTNHDPDHCSDAEGARWRLSDPQPLLLIGQWSKWLDYQLYYYSALMEAFREALSSTKVVVSSGYGWGDWGINERLLDWVRSDKDRQLVILCAEPEHDILHPRHPRIPFSIANQPDGRIQIIRHWLSDVRWEEIKNRPGLFGRVSSMQSGS